MSSGLVIVFALLGLWVFWAILAEVRTIRDESEKQTRLLAQVREHLDRDQTTIILAAIREYLEFTQRNLLARMGTGKPPWDE